MKPNKDNPKQDGNFSVFNFLLVGLVVTVLFNVFFSSGKTESKFEEISYNRFILLVENDLVDNVEVKDDRYIINLKSDIKQGEINSILYDDYELDEIISSTKDILNEDLEDENIGTDVLALLPSRVIKEYVESNKSVSSKKYFTGAIYNPELINLLLDKNVEFIKPTSDNSKILFTILEWVIPFALIYGFFSLIMRSMSKKMGGGSGGIMNIGKSNAKMYNMEKKTGISFADVAGQDEAKESLTEIIDYLHFPEKYVEIGAKQPKGALLVGPPGTGKTLLAKAVAGEANVPFFSLTGSEFVEMYVGVGASRVRDLFKLANEHAPSIIFIDEIDAIGKSRDNQMSSNDEREQTLNQLLAEMDGFDTSKGVVILAATNRPEILDKALLRPGRFDRRIIVEKPDLIGREAILKVHAKKVKLDKDVDLRQIALATSGAAGADLANMINEAALRAVRMDRNAVKQEDLMEAVEVVIAGKEKKDRILSDKEKEIVAFHEVGHALTAALQKNTQPVQKITIVPRTHGSLGYVMQMPEEDRYLMTKEEFLAEIVTLLGGRAAEVIMFNTSTTGASNDIERATKMARNMVSMYGMSDKFGIMGLESVENRYLDGRAISHVSSQTEAELDKEVKIILDECYEKALSIIRENQDVLRAIAEFLIEKENISGEEFMEILKEHKPDFEEENEIMKKEKEKLRTIDDAMN